ncbi:MAG: DUF748 domain-containing protein [Candidatus Omnitrophica bacterium]|nr:DUF748 domain-containing protein [Candidatus Omnitrophota bacterium]
MKTIIKIIIWGIVLFLIVFSALAVYISFFGKKMLVGQLQDRLGMPVELEEVTLKLPLSVNLKKLELSDLAKVREISFTPILPALLSGRIVIDDLRLVEPVIELVKNSDGSLNFSLPHQETESGFKVIISGLKVEEGRVSYLDRSVSSAGVKTILDHLNLDISKTLFPLNRINLKYRLSCGVSDADDKKIGSLSGQGWVNLINKSARANLLVDNLDIAYFQPYYGDLVSKKKLLSATLSLDSQAEAEDNDLEIKSSLLLSGLVYESGDPADSDASGDASLDISSIIGNALDLFIDDSGRLELNFTLNTKLDSPRISVDQLKKAIMAAVLTNLSGQSPERIIEKFESIVDRFKDFGGQMEDMFKKRKD